MSAPSEHGGRVELGALRTALREAEAAGVGVEQLQQQQQLLQQQLQQLQQQEQQKKKKPGQEQGPQQPLLQQQLQQQLEQLQQQQQQLATAIAAVERQGWAERLGFGQLALAATPLNPRAWPGPP